MINSLRFFLTWFAARVGFKQAHNKHDKNLGGTPQADHHIQPIKTNPDSKVLPRRRVHWPGTASPNNAGPYPSIARTDDSPPWRPHHIIIISLSYPNKRWSEGSSALDGPKSDLRLLLNYLQYRHRSEPRRWYFLTDFDFEYTDSSGVMDIVPTVLATKRNIQTALQGVMEELRDTCLIYYDGHANVEPPSEDADQAPAYLVATDGQRIYGEEFYAWLRESRSPNSTITVVFDACNSAHFLGLPYSYETEKKREFEVVTPSTEVVTSQVIEISSARKDQPLFSGSFGKEKTLTWYLIHYLQANPQADLAGLASYFYANCEPSGSGFPACDQERGHLPVLSCSRKLDGRFSLF